MKRAVILSLIICLTLLICSCSGVVSESVTNSPSNSAETATATSPPSENVTPVTDTPVTGGPETQTPSPPPVETPPPELPARPESTALTMELSGTEMSLEADLVYQNLNENPFLAFSIYRITGEYVISSGESLFRFTSLSDTGAFMEIVFVSGTEPVALRASFADSYGTYTDYDYLPYQTIGEENLRCISLVASGSGERLEAYFTAVNGGTVAFVISSSDENPGNEPEKLRVMLSTLVLYD